MLSYHNDQTIKDKYVLRMRQHIAADELIKGVGYENGKGCFIGCTLNNYDHAQFEKELGVPEWLARLFDKLHENISKERAVSFKYTLEDIPVGIELDKIKAPFMIFVLNDVFNYFDNVKYPDVTKCIKDVINLYETVGCPDDSMTWVNISAAAWAAAEAAEVAYWATRSAERPAARAARAAVWAARAAVWTTATAVEAVAAAARAADVEAAAYDKFADKLIELIKECK